MAESFQTPGTEASQACLRFFQELLRGYCPRNFAIELWDGVAWPPEQDQPCRFVWKIHSPQFLRRIAASPGEVSLGQAYISGDCDARGDLEAAFPLLDFLFSKRWTLPEKLRLANLIHRLPRECEKLRALEPVRLKGSLHSKDRDRQAVRYHYDLSNDFYQLWLDKEMLYSAAHFEKATDDLDAAQRHRLEHICRSLQLREGERLLDIGCGWGGLVLHAAREHGARSLGITLSPQQQEYAEVRIRQAGFGEQCEVKLLDYRDLNSHAPFDKIVSVGMVEHVGQSKLPEYFQTAFRLLKAGGIFLLSGIGRPGCVPAPSAPTFVGTYVFPDGELVPPAKTLQEAERAGFDVQSMENLREHYEMTLRHWVRRLEARAQEARALVGETRYRIWRLYMTGAAYYFHSGRLGLYETLLLKTSGGRAAC